MHNSTSKLEGGFGYRVHNTTDARLDMQGYTTVKDEDEETRCFNLQVQINKSCKRKSLQRYAPGSFAVLLVPVHENWTAEQIKEGLIASVTGYVVSPPKTTKAEPSEATKETK
ncbi:hypothetical protein BDV95DRAFT_622804 [Massariosphaeria phaeospora]|uniref:Uncharacterized protein n=1 Tax=Massariosphaeria phaeospora TaxID=100035 RepID=A0A7C8I4E2_9PLEO|nr:hypothetical protein BDV95DRAFT_622804 [Massariosphaeria phaeospora]